MKFDDNDDILCEFLSRRGSVGVEPSLGDGTEVGEWRIAGFIGRGGSSEVYCVRRMATGEPAALKILHRTEPQQIERFARESRFLEDSVHDRHFPCFYGKGVVNGRPYIVVEILDPLPLPCKDRDVARYLCAVAEGVGSLHVANLVHRDIKPGNILLRTSRPPLDDRTHRPVHAEPVIIDLGLVKDISRAPISSDNRVSMVDGREVGVGTPRYAAPEQFSGGEATPAMDIHALGRLAYECFGGKPPRTWSRIIRRATSSIPGERYQTAYDFIRAVRRRHLARNMGFSLIVAVSAACLAVVWAVNGGAETVRWASLGEDVATNVVKDVLVREVLETNEVPIAGTKLTYKQVLPVRRCYRPVTNRVEATFVRLGGATNVFARPMRLDPKRELWVVGPGTLDVGFVDSKGAKVLLDNCVLVNRTRETLNDAGIRYEMGYRSKMDFTEIKIPTTVEAEAFINPYSPVAVRFGRSLPTSQTDSRSLICREQELLESRHRDGRRGIWTSH